MNDVQIMSLLALLSMSVPAALAFLYWRERNQALHSFNDLEYAYRSMLTDRNLWREKATVWCALYEDVLYEFDDSDYDTIESAAWNTSRVALPDDTRQWDFN